jgi:hypothetical protein
MTTPDLYSIILEIIKYAAIAIGSALGLLGIMTDTRDKKTNKITPWGKRISAIILIAGLFAIVSQSIESYLKKRSDEIAKSEQIKSQKKLESIISSANDITKNVDSVQGNLIEVMKSAEKGIEEINKTIAKSDAIIKSQKITLKEMERLTYPLDGNIKMFALIEYPIMTGLSGLEDSEWIKRIKPSINEQLVLYNDDNNEFNPNPILGEGSEYRLLKETMFTIFINKNPTDISRSNNFSNFGACDLWFETQFPKTSLNILIGRDNKIEEQFYSGSIRKGDNKKIISYPDLYNSELIIRFPDTAPKGSKILNCILYFGNGEPIFIGFTDSDRRTYCLDPPNDEPFTYIAYVKILTKNELGSRNK